MNWADCLQLLDLHYRAAALTRDPCNESSGSPHEPPQDGLVEVYDIDPWGRARAFDDPGPDGRWFSDDDAETFDPVCRYLFTGREYEPQTGLYYFRARHYLPDLGVFTSRDPLLYDAGDMNLYRYTFGDPIGELDPSGEAIPLLVLGFLALATAGTAATVGGTALMSTRLDAQIAAQNHDMNDPLFSFGARTVQVGSVAAMTGMAGAGGWAIPGLLGAAWGVSTILGMAATTTALGLGITGLYGTVKGASELAKDWREMDTFDRVTGVAALTLPLIAGGMTARGLGSSSFRAGFFWSARRRLLSDPRVLLYRGYNATHARYQQALGGIAKPNRPWWMIWVRSSTPWGA